MDTLGTAGSLGFCTSHSLIRGACRLLVLLVLPTLALFRVFRTVRRSSTWSNSGFHIVISAGGGDTRSFFLADCSILQYFGTQYCCVSI